MRGVSCVRKVGLPRAAHCCGTGLDVLEQEGEADDRKHHDEEDDDRHRLRARLEDLAPLGWTIVCTTTRSAAGTLFARCCRARNLLSASAPRSASVIALLRRSGDCREVDQREQRAGLVVPESGRDDLSADGAFPPHQQANRVTCRELGVEDREIVEPARVGHRGITGGVVAGS